MDTALRKITESECAELLSLADDYLIKKISDENYDQSFAGFLNNNFTATDFIFTRDSRGKLLNILLETAEKYSDSFFMEDDSSKEIKFVTDILNENYFI